MPNVTVFFLFPMWGLISMLLIQPDPSPLLSNPSYSCWYINCYHLASIQRINLINFNNIFFIYVWKLHFKPRNAKPDIPGSLDNFKKIFMLAYGE